LPAGDHGYDQSVLSPLIVAHRAGNQPSVATDAVRRADVVECDVHVQRGRVEVRHEKLIRPTSRLWERWYLLPAGTVMPSLDEVLAAVPPDVPLLLDLKCFTRRAARRIRRAVPEDRPILVSSRSWWVLAAFRDRPGTIRLRSCGNRLQLRAVTMVPGLGDRVGVVAHNRLLDAEAIGPVLAKTPQLFTWAVETLERGRHLVTKGVAGLIVDDLDLDWASLHLTEDNGPALS